MTFMVGLLAAFAVIQFSSKRIIALPMKSSFMVCYRQQYISFLWSDSQCNTDQFRRFGIYRTTIDTDTQ